ncbi:bifunctional adenosylcobinamide kinase/adenosylcobinamide-phosphate guanylyltransferase [Sporosarcina sp. PTS2304]|uniref:bifunctional adenosylcobinamide kinase/adenosylcobinamide-phosphate guanylyltransferase n=1 Tax=Sporosarcina sp. PTS2304 TaxID=2283194 RepID=UPI000E0D8FCA|nr:bifunctional adenosylcobinamide kinase/adenosylcobinamide-phosphate guanylyltransferase [Sporosarcina sp. PTS2304]AXI01080.1 bifunctional adenosylcobinamide kinase/adenosylcobinamide-phosphate guanylyltransferase [Sporosarcina sp. PTS2304]
MVRGTVTFISGGARSGKSAYAEKILVAQPGRLVYIASGVAADSEMKERIAKHQNDRKLDDWHTIEQPVDIHRTLPFLQEGDLVLWDCMTTWLANELYEGYDTGDPCWRRVGCLEMKAEQLLQTIGQISERVTSFVIVSNEVLDEWSDYGEETQRYRKTIGLLHQRLVALCDVAIEMDHGIPVVWKGESP